MKKLATFSLAILLLLALTGCGEAAKDISTTEIVENLTTETVENSTTEKTEPEYCGTWKIAYITKDGTKYVLSELEALDDYRSRAVLVIKEGGNAYVAEGGKDGVIVEWSKTDVGILLGGEDMILVNDLLRFNLDDEIWYFQKITDSQLIEKSVDTQTQEVETEETKETEQTASETMFLADAEPVNDEVYVSGNFEFVHYTDGSIELTKYTGSDTSVDISKEISGYPVSRIGSGAFENCSTVENIYFWADIISIGEAAFRNCSELESFDIPSTVTTIEASTFENCTSLENIYVWGDVTGIGEAAFRNCSELESFDIPSTVTTIETSTFENCTSLENIFIWGDVTKIGDSAFQNCESLTSIDIPSSCTSIGASAFEGCVELKSVYYWGKRVECGFNAFANCPSLKDISEGIVYAKSESVVGEALSESTVKENTTLVDGMRPEFKEAMDAYEAFYIEYCEFMKEYKKNPTDPQLLTEYSELLMKVVDVDEAFSAWDEDELNNEELKYYIAVNSRVVQKMVEVTG